MQNDVSLSLAAICLGIAVTGLALTLNPPQTPLQTPPHSGGIRTREHRSLGLVFAAFAGIVAWPLVATHAPGAYVVYAPLILIMLLALPPAVYHFVLAKTAQGEPGGVPWWDYVMPAMACAVCLWFWSLPSATQSMMVIDGRLPPGFGPAALALLTFVLIVIWLVTSAVYVWTALARLRGFRADLRQRYSNLETRDLRWVDWGMAWLGGLWAAVAVSLGLDNLGGGTPIPGWALYALTAGFLLALVNFATRDVPLADIEPDPQAPSPPAEGKYARSALTADHAQKLAGRIDDAMRREALYLDPNLSLQKLSRRVGAAPNLVSQTLNDVIGESFFDYVARWRIEASKPLILAQEASVLTVALDVGFNSRSTFYKAFKRETGVTPKAFRAAAR